jgi:chromosome condensin MukBEF ATPase and DNA-binding subunit MukB
MTDLDYDSVLLFSGLLSDSDDVSVSTDSSGKSSSSGRKRLYNSDELKEKNKEWCKQSRHRRKKLVEDVVTFCKSELQTLTNGLLELERNINQPNATAFLVGRLQNLQTVFDEMEFH